MPIRNEILTALKNHDPRLTTIHMENCYPAITAQDIRLLVDAAIGNPHLKKLNFVENNIGDEGCKFLSNLHYLEELVLSTNEITSIGATYLAKLPNLKKLILSENRIDDKGLEILLQNKTLRELHIDFNPITEAGAKLVLDNPTLTKLLIKNEHELISSNSLLNKIQLKIEANKSNIEKNSFGEGYINFFQAASIEELSKKELDFVNLIKNHISEMLRSLPEPVAEAHKSVLKTHINAAIDSIPIQKPSVCNI